MVNRSKVFDEAGLGMVERGKLMTSVLTSKNLSGILDRIDADTSISDANKEKLLRSVADKYKKDPQAIDRLEKDLAANPALAKRLEQAIKANPAAIAERGIPAYTGGNLESALNGAVPAAKPAAGPSPSPAAAPAGKKPDARPETTAPATKPERHTTGRRHQANPAAEPATPSGPAAAPAAPSMNPADLKEILGTLAGAKNEEITKIVDAQGPKLVNGMAHGMADMARDKFGVPRETTDAFEKRIKDDPKLQQAITENFKRNPDFVRQMAKMAQGGGDVPDAMKEMARKEMDKVMQNPQLLADDKYVKDVSRQMRMGNSMGRVAGFMQDTFGIDMSGMMNGMGGFFKGIANWFKDFFGAFSGGGVKDFLSQPSNKNLGMFDKLSAGIGFAMNKANNTPSSQYESAYLQNAGILAGKDGSYFHNEKRKDANGVESTHRVPNTIDVRTVNGSVHKVVPTEAPLEFKALPGGNYEIRMVTDMKEGAKPGDRPTVTGKSGPLVVTLDELKEIQRKTGELMKDQPQKNLRLQDVVEASPPTRGLEASAPTTINKTTVDPQNGQVGSTVQTFPVRDPGVPEIRPLEPAPAAATGPNGIKQPNLTPATPV